MAKFWDSWMLWFGIMCITSCIDRIVTVYERDHGTGPFKGCVCAPKEDK